MKLNIVKEIESGKLTLSQAQKQYGIQGDSTIRNWLKRYGNFDWENQIPSNMEKSPEQRILELEAKVRLLEKQKAQLEHQNHIADSKAIIFDMMIDIAEKYQYYLNKYQLRCSMTENSDPYESAIAERINGILKQ
ncbi:helix-turn-helix domain-containing protein [Sphingobacterium sp.]|uniref:helix-turn-helix domain-containing protein n=1 Tax=Sphingobacterium sp. TaxID=341027 RepID=UPI00289C8593|nr:helix-turn-helix domain-containing protein [Sphingobacterium sp.]